MNLDYLLEAILIFMIGVILVVLPFKAFGGVVMTVNFYDGTQVVRQFENEEEFLMTFQAREHCAPGWSHFEVKRELIKGLDNES